MKPRAESDRLVEPPASRLQVATLSANAALHTQITTWPTSKQPNPLDANDDRPNTAC